MPAALRPHRYFLAALLLLPGCFARSCCDDLPNGSELCGNGVVDIAEECDGPVEPGADPADPRWTTGVTF